MQRELESHFAILENAPNMYPLELEVISKLREKISQCKEKSQIDETCKLEWPNGTFTKTFTNPRELNGEKAFLKSTLVYLTNFKEDENFIKLQNLIPEIAGISSENFTNLGTIQIENNNSHLWSSGFPKRKVLLCLPSIAERTWKPEHSRRDDLGHVDAEDNEKDSDEYCGNLYS